MLTKLILYKIFNTTFNATLFFTVFPGYQLINCFLVLFQRQFVLV